MSCPNPKYYLLLSATSKISPTWTLPTVNLPLPQRACHKGLHQCGKSLCCCFKNLYTIAWSFWNNMANGAENQRCQTDSHKQLTSSVMLVKQQNNDKRRVVSCNSGSVVGFVICTEQRKGDVSSANLARSNSKQWTTQAVHEFHPAVKND